MSLAKDIVAELIGEAADTAIDYLNGVEPDPEALALKLAQKGLKLVGHEAMKRLLTQAAADRINAEVDAEP